MQCACAILSPVASLTLQDFSTLSHKRYNFQKNKLPGVKCVLWFSPQFLSKTFFILGRIEQDMIKCVSVCM